MEQTKHEMTLYTKDSDLLNTAHFNSIVENVETLYENTENYQTEETKAREEADQKILEQLKANKQAFDLHSSNKNNPHGVTAEQLNLGNVDNTSDADKPVSTAQQAAINAVQSNLNMHEGNTSNPHNVNKEQVGLGNVPNVSTNDQTPSYTEATTLAALISGEKLSTAFGKISKAVSSLISHLTNKANPHEVTKIQVGLGNVNNTSDTDKPVSSAQQTAINQAEDNAKSYTDEKITDLIGGAPETLDTLKEVADALAEHESIAEALDSAIGTKASQSDLNAHTGNTTVHITSTERTDWNDANSKKHEHSNQALLDTYTQTEVNLKSAVDNKHTHTNKSVLDGITATLVTTWNNAVSAQHSHTNKSVLDTITQAMLDKLDGIADGANKTIVDSALSATSVNPVQNKVINTALAAKAASSHTHTKAQISDFPTTLPPTAHNQASDTIDAMSGYTKPTTTGAITTSDTLNSAIGKLEKALDGKQASGSYAAASHTHSNYLPLSGGTMTGNLTLKGAPTSDLMAATKKYVDDLASSKGAGDMLKSVYDVDEDGVVDNAAKVNGLTVLTAVPANAKFTDTNTWRGIQNNLTSDSTTDSLSAAQGKALKTLVDAKAASSHTHNYAGSSSAGGAATSANSLNAQNIAANTDLNTITTPGFYYCPANATVKTLTNCPTSNALFMIVGKHAGVYQQIIEYMTSGYKMYMRNYYSSAWGSWDRIYTSIDKPTVSDLGAASSSHTHSAATISAAGFMSAADKTKLDGIATGATANSASTTTPKVAGTASVGTENAYARGDHIHPVQTSVSGNAGTATKLATARTIDGVSFNGSAAIIHYGTCSTAAATAEKAVTLSGFTLVTGAMIFVKFTVTNTAASPTLNVNSTGAKAIYYRGSAISAGYLAASRTYTFVYNGTQYELIGDLNTNTTYSAMTAATASAAGKTGLVPAPAAGAQAKFLRGDGTWQTPTNTTYSAATQSANGLMSAADKKKLDGLTDENVIRNITIATSAFAANTDSYKAVYPYYADYTISGMTATCDAQVNFSPATLLAGSVSAQAQTLSDKIRIYAEEMPSAAVVIDNIIWKEVG